MGHAQASGGEGRLAQCANTYPPAECRMAGKAHPGSRAPRTTRRRVVGATVAGVAGLAFLPRGLVKRAGRASPSATPAAAPDIERALASETMHRAVQTWGPVSPGALGVTAYGERMLAFYH